MNRPTWKIPMLLALLLSACGGGNAGTCKSPVDCAKGQSCQAGSCVKAAALKITSPDTLPPAMVKQAYSVGFQATGGVGARTWSAKGLPGWLSLDASSGQLSGSTDTAAPGAPITITVTDSQGSTAGHQYTLVVDGCQPNTSVTCYLAQGSACIEGTATCASDGTPGSCQATGNPTSDLDHCGAACGACDSKVADSCTNGKCYCGGSLACATGETCCTKSCVDTSSDVANCGGCGIKCDSQYPNGTVSCVAGGCQSQCNPGYGDCDSNPTNGCEANLNTDVQNCGSCLSACNSATADSCTNGKCSCGGGPACTNGQTCCNQKCVDTTSDLANCGGCGVQCPQAQANETEVCSGGSCQSPCNTGYADCDTNPANGCEAKLSTDPTNCGACLNNCQTQVPPQTDGTGVCSAGTCDVQCSSTYYLNCDGRLDNGCETNVSKDASCGGCGTNCGVYTTNGHAHCEHPIGSPPQTYVCSFLGAQNCNTGYYDCDGQLANGCETHIAADVNNCGSCGYACPSHPNEIPSCQSGACQYTCQTGYGDCDGALANGCETNLQTTTADCGSCGNVCVNGEACRLGACCLTKSTACLPTAGSTPCCGGTTCSLNPLWTPTNGQPLNICQ